MQRKMSRVKVAGSINDCNANKNEKEINFKSNGVPKLKFNTGWEYAPAPESKSHIKLKDRYDLFINGKFVKPSSGKYFETINPATEEKIAEIAEANAADVDKAVKAARNAYERVWKKCRRQKEQNISSAFQE